MWAGYCDQVSFENTALLNKSCFHKKMRKLKWCAKQDYDMMLIVREPNDISVWKLRVFKLLRLNMF